MIAGQRRKVLVTLRTRYIFQEALASSAVEVYEI